MEAACLNMGSVPKRPGRTVGPCRTVVHSVPGRVSKDARAKRPNFTKLAVLGVDGRALASSAKWDLPAVIYRALQGPAVMNKARPLSAGLCCHQ